MLRNSYHPYAMVTVLFWSLGYVFTRLAMGYFSAYSLAFLRYLVASCFLLVVALCTKMKPPRREDLGWLALSGLACSFLYMITFNTGGSMVTAATSSVVLAIVPIFTAVMARLFYKERLAPLQWFACGLEFCGILLLTLTGDSFSVNTGVLLLLLAASLLSLYNIIQRRLLRTYSALQASAFGMFAGTIPLAIFLPAAAGELRDAPGIQLVYVLVLGMFSSGVAYLSWSKAFRLAEKTSSVSNYMFLTPFMTSILGFVIAAELPDLGTLLGGAVVLGGMLVFNCGARIAPKDSLPANDAGQVG